jgi:hypothetical protein
LGCEVVCLSFFSFLFFFNSFSPISFPNFYSKSFQNFKPTFDHSINSKTMHST